MLWPRPGYSPVAPPVAAAAVVWYPSAALSGGQPVSEGSTDQQVAAEASASLFPRVTPAILAMLVPSAQTTRREVEIAVSAALPLMRKGSEWAGLGREGADLRRALQAYGEGQYRGWVTFFPPSFVTTAMAEGWRVLAGRSSPRKDAGSEEARASQDPGRGRRKVKATFVGGEDSIDGARGAIMPFIISRFSAVNDSTNISIVWQLKNVQKGHVLFLERVLSSIHEIVPRDFTDSRPNTTCVCKSTSKTPRGLYLKISLRSYNLEHRTPRTMVSRSCSIQPALRPCACQLDP